MTKIKLGIVDDAEFNYSGITFRDESGEECAIQTCSDVSRLIKGEPSESLLLGVKEPICHIHHTIAKSLGIQGEADEAGFVKFELPKGVSIASSMRLSNTQVQGLIIRLQQWLDDGYFSDK